MNAKWKRNGSSLVLSICETDVPLKVVGAWKRLMKADNDLAFVINERKCGAEWADMNALEKARIEAGNAAINWQAVCRAMGWKSPNGRTLSVHLTPSH
jgi:hypothetical protein